MKFTIHTLGCDKNTVDSERYLAELVAHGGTPAESAEEADVIVINTCGFIDAAKKESIDALLEAARLKSGGRCRAVAAVGCMVERHEDELRRELPEVDIFLGASRMTELVPQLSARGLLDDAPLREHPGVRLFTGHHPHIRYLKISEGCDHGCAFCAIPLMRGRHRSFAIDDLVREAQLLEMQGAREINLVAQDLAHYGRDVRDGHGLVDLLQALLRETGVPWFRLLYIYSAGLTDRMLELLAREPRIVRYLDIPMQHAADTMLARMRRPERQARQRALLARLRDAVPDIALRTTVIVGFPGETDNEFRQLLEFLDEARFDRVGVFTYSAQEGTRAARLSDDVPEEVKLERQERVLELQRLVTLSRYEALLGRTVRAMVDEPSEDARPAHARVEGQADDIDGITLVHTSAAPGSVIEARLDAVVDDVDFEATWMRTIDAAPAPRRTIRGRQLPTFSTVGAYGR